MTIYRCTASGIFASGQVWSFRQHFDSTAAISAISGDWNAALLAAWTDATHGLQTLYPVGTVMNASSAAALSGTPFREGLKQVGTLAAPGTNVGDSLPEQDCIVVSLRGAAVGRKNRGRIHLPAPSKTVPTGGIMSSTDGTRVSTAMNALYAQMRIAGHNPVVYNTKVSVDDPIIQTTKPIVTEEADRVIRTLRKRTKGQKAIYA